MQSRSKDGGTIHLTAGPITKPGTRTADIDIHGCADKTTLRWIEDACDFDSCFIDLWPLTTTSYLQTSTNLRRHLASRREKSCS